MTVKELYDELSVYIERGQGDLNVIANCDFVSPWECKKGEEIGDFCLCNLNDVYYQSGDIELGFSDKKGITMFEKEAEEWVKENMGCCRSENCTGKDIPYFDEEERCIAKSAFQDGAEFGYNKGKQEKNEQAKEIIIRCKEQLSILYFKVKANEGISDILSEIENFLKE